MHCYRNALCCWLVLLALATTVLQARRLNKGKHLTAFETDIKPALNLKTQLYRTNKVLDAIDAALLYLKRHNASVNLDGVIGIRQIEGQLGGLLARHLTGMTWATERRLRDTQRLAGNVATVTQEAAKRLTPVYFSRVDFLVQPHFWDLFLPSQLLSSTAIDMATMSREATLAEDVMSEEMSDNCLREFIKTDDHESCSVSANCWRTMNSDGVSGYSLTHHVFYYLVGIQAGCGELLQKLALTTAPNLPISQRLNQMCALIKQEASMLARDGPYAEDRDLFMEQIGMCGIAGFDQLANSDWLNRVLTWQADSGCYHQFEEEHLAAANFAPNTYGQVRKRAESFLSSGRKACLSHRTSVALSALVVFLRRSVAAEALIGLEQQQLIDQSFR